MNRAGRRDRLAALEAKARAEDVAPIVLWWADTDAGLWREGVGREDEEGGRVEAMTPEEVAEVRAEGSHRVRITGLPKRGRA